MHFNWVDGLVVIVLVVSAFHGWRMGGLRLAGTLLSFLLAFWLATRLAPVVGVFLKEKFGITRLWGELAGYTAIAILGQYALSLLFTQLSEKVPTKIAGSRYISLMGVIIGIFNGILILGFFLLIFLFLPVRGTVRNDIENSLIARRIADGAKAYGGDFSASLDSLTQATVRFLTVTPGTRDRTNLPFLPGTIQLRTDQASEQLMLNLINEERTKAHVSPLTVDTKLRALARAHSTDMMEHHYFSHVDLTGKDGTDRMKAAGISYTSAGENLAYSADVPYAHQGFMESPTHRQNILDPAFHHIGIGIIDAGFYGKMITQDFTD